MTNNRIARWTIVFGMTAVLVGGSRLNAQPRFETSFQDKGWKAMQETARPWTREEMLSAIPDDIPAVSEATLQQWAYELLKKPTYDTKGGPRVEPGAGPGGRTAQMAEPPIVQDAVDKSVQELAGGYSYPAPFTRYEVFPNYSGYPHITVGKVFFTKPGIGNFVCSGSSIGGDGVITAAHCVHDSNSGAFWTNWTFVPAYKNGTAPYGQWSANHLWFISNYQNNAGGDSRYDIGGAVLNRKSGVKISQKVGFLGFAWNQDNGSLSAHWALIGYPAASPFNGNLMYICQASYAYSAGGSAPSPIGVGCDQTGGTSGGPWIRNYSGASGASNYVNGVNSYRRCVNASCTSVFTNELFSPYFDNTAKALKDCIVNSVPGNPANPAQNCAPGT